MSAVDNGGTTEILKDEQLKPEITDETKSEPVKEKTKRLGFFASFSRRMRTLFRRRKRVSKIEEKQLDAEIEPDKKAEELEKVPDPIPEPPHESPEHERKSQHISPSPKKVPVFLNDFTAELKTTLKSRSRDDTNPSKPEKEDPELLQLVAGRSTSFCDDDLPSPREFEINQEGRELKSFGEKRALFESQTSGGDGSLTRSEKRVSRSVSAKLEDGVIAENEDDTTNCVDHETVLTDESTQKITIDGDNDTVQSTMSHNVPEVTKYGDTLAHEGQEGEDVVIKELDDVINTLENDEIDTESMDKMISNMCQEIIDSSLQELTNENSVNENGYHGENEQVTS